MGLQVVEAHSLFPYFLEKRLAIPTSPFFHLLVNGFSVTCFRTFVADPLLTDPITLPCSLARAGNNVLTKILICQLL